MLAAANKSQKANGCPCPAAPNSDTPVDPVVTVYPIPRLWGVVTENTIVGAKHPRWTVAIYFLVTDTNYWARGQWLDGQWQVVVSIILPQHSMIFPRYSVVCLLVIDITCVDIFGILPRFLENLLENENVVCSAAAQDENNTHPPAWVQLFRGTFLKGTWHAIFQRAKERDALVISTYIHSCLTSCVSR